MSAYFEDRLESILEIAGFHFKDIETTTIDEMLKELKDVYTDGKEEGKAEGIKEMSDLVF